MKNTLLRLIKYIQKYKLYVLLSLISALVSGIVSLIGPLLIGKAIDRMVLEKSVDFKALVGILFILAVVYISANIFNWSLTYLTNIAVYRSVNDMRRELFDKVNTLPLNFFDTNSHGDITSRFVNDMDTTSDGMLQCLSTLLMGVVTIIGALGFMLYINPLMTLVVLLSSPAAFFAARFVTKSSQKMFKQQAAIVGKLNGYAEEIISGQKTVKAFNYEHRSFEKFKSINSDLHDVGVKAQFYSSLANPTTRLVNNITYSIIGIIGSVAAILGSITVGDISSFLIYSNLFSKPLNELSAIFTQIQAAMASAQRIFKILDLPSEIPDSAEAVNLQNCKGLVDFKDVNFSYKPDAPLITNFNLKAAPGSRIAIVGHTGAGKTTLVNLLMRFYEVNSGCISVDGIDITKITRDSLRRNIGMVLQDTWLFSGSIKDNLAYGKPDATEAEIVQAAKAAGAHSFIRRLPEGYNTIITGSGENLSLGQKQLLTIARVMLIDPPMLILDEATSSIDTRTELRIQKSFLKMMEGRTSFVIAHRLSTIKESDLILVMDKGNIVESGTHEQLIKLGKHYAELYNSQFKLI